KGVSGPMVGSPGSKMLRLMITTVSMIGAGAWADRRPGGRAASTTTKPTARPPDRLTALFDRVDALMERMRGVVCGIVPLREVQGRVDSPGELPQPPSRQQEATPNRILPQRPEQAGDRGVRRNPGRRRADLVRRVRAELADPPQLEAERHGVLVAQCRARVEFVTDEHDVTPRPRVARVDAQPSQGDPRIAIDHETPVPFPAPQRLDAGRVAGAGHEVATAQRERGEGDATAMERQPSRASTKCHSSTAENSPNRSCTSRSLCSRKI